MDQNLADSSLINIKNQKLKVMISTNRGKEGVGGGNPLGVLQEDSAPLSVACPAAYL